MNYYTDKIPTWTYRVLKTCGNVALSREVVDYYGVEYLRELLTDIMGAKVVITASWQRDYGEVTSKKHKEYVAWMKD